MSSFFGVCFTFSIRSQTGAKDFKNLKMTKKITLLILFISSLSFSQVIVSKKLQDPENKIIQKLTKRSQIWISGEWIENNNKYVWKKGYWAQKKPGYIYIQGYWEKRKNGRR